MASFIREPARRTPVIGQYDVVVAGGGPAGVSAAVAAGRKGAKVLLIEQTGCLGGSGTAGLVPCFSPYSYHDKAAGDIVMRGAALEVLNRLEAMGGTDRSSWPSIDAEKLKLLYDQMAAQAKVRVLYFTQVAGAVVKAGKVRAVLIQNKVGRQAVTGKVYIDATGDADLAAAAGAAFDKGDAKGKMQSTTLCFTVAGVDTQAYLEGYRSRFQGRNANLTEWLQQNQRQGVLPAVKGCEYRVIAQKVISPSVLGYNFGHVFGVDGTDPVAVSAAMAAGRQIAHNYVQFARKHIAGMAGAEVVATGAILGVRETRRVRGRVSLELKDLCAARHFDDDVAACDYPVDVHASVIGRRGAKTTDRLMDTLRLPPGRTYGIPLGILLAEKFENLMIAGRNVSADRMVQASLRVMPACLNMGQAAGTAAAMAVRQGVAVAKVDVARLQRTLVRDGARLA